MMAVWMVLASIAILFFLGSVWLLAQALFKTRVLQWAKHRKTTIGIEALWTWRIALVLTLLIGMGEYRKLGNPVMGTTLTIAALAGLFILALGLLVWLAAMHARKHYLWYFQVLAPKEELPPYSTNGIYATVRNPRELGLLLVLAGLSLALGMTFTFIFTVLLVFVTGYRANSRDRIMLEKYGKAYIDYMRTSKKLIPYLY